MRKERIQVRLSRRLHAKLMAATQAPNVSLSAIVEAALAAYFDPAPADGRAKTILDRFDAFDLRQAQLEREVALNVEMTAQFVLYWLTVTDPIPENERASAHALAQRRYGRFVERVTRKLLSDERVSKRIFGDLAEAPDERSGRESNAEAIDNLPKP